MWIRIFINSYPQKKPSRTVHWLTTHLPSETCPPGLFSLRCWLKTGVPACRHAPLGPDSPSVQQRWERNPRRSFTRSQTIYGHPVETYGPYSQNYTSRYAVTTFSYSNTINTEASRAKNRLIFFRNIHIAGGFNRSFYMVRYTY